MADDANEVLLAALRAEMKRQRRSGGDLARVLGKKSRNAATERLSGRRQFTAAELVKVAEWLGVPLNDLVQKDEGGLRQQSSLPQELEDAVRDLIASVYEAGRRDSATAA